MSPTATPAVVGAREELDHALAGVRREGRRVTLVPTMGALHEGHQQLLTEARNRTPEGLVVASVFVNPLQFGAGEDLESYPRTFDDDLDRCRRAGVDVVFAPGVEQMYPLGTPEVTVDPGPLGTVLEGESRPRHFSGVLTVVARLFGLVRPDLALFGEKDYQQLVLVRRMVADLCLRVEVDGVATVRQPDGLALSSRNAYLDPAQRAAAPALADALAAGAAAGPLGAVEVLAAAGDVLARTPSLVVDYLRVTAPDLGPVPDSGDARLLVAARLGATRLIDNTEVVLGSLRR